MTAPVSPRDLLHAILAAPDVIEDRAGLLLVVRVSRKTLAALETFGAESEDMESNGDLEPSILSHDDLEDDSAGRGSAPPYSDDPEVPQIITHSMY